MSDSRVPNQPVVETEEELFQRLLKDAGFVRKEKQVSWTTQEERVEKIGALLQLLQKAKEMKDEAGAKKIRRTLRKSFGFSIRKHMKVVI